MNLLNRILFGTKYGICAFCGRRIERNNAVFHKDNICICKNCNSRIDVAPFLYTYDGTKHLSFTVAPLYYTGIIRDAIHKLKFSAMDGIAEALSYYVLTYLEVFETTDESLLKDFDFLVPVPLSPERFSERGYNQAEIIAKAISEKFNIPLRTDILIKIKDTRPQSTLSRNEREANIKDAYNCTKDVCGKNIILIDDVFTTGYTLDYCAKALKEQGADNVIAITVTHGTQKGHSDIYYDLFS